MADIIQIRRDLAANWTSANPILAQGEFGWEIDTNALRIGDGSTAYNTLSPVFQNTIGSVFGRTGAVVAQNGDYTAGQITYNNTASGLTGITVQAAVDQLDTRLDAVEALPGAPVDSVYGRTGAVVAVAGDYDADQVDYDNTASGLTATDAQGAIDELAAAPNVPVFQARNTDTTTNINAGLAFLPIMGTIDQPGPAGYFTVLNGNQVTCDLAMKVKVSWSIAMTSTQARANVAIDSVINFATQSVRSYNSYIRAANGHNESSSSGYTILDVAAGDEIGLACQQVAAAGTVTMIDGEAVIIIEVLELL